MRSEDVGVLRAPALDPQARIAELELALTASREREQWFRALVENSLDIVTRFDAQFRHVYVNPAVIPVTGLPPAYWIGRTHRELGFSESFVQLWETHIAHALRSNTPVEIEFDYEAPTGLRHFLARLVPEIGPSGQAETVLSLSRDVTDRKRAEQALSEAQIQLLHTEKLASLGQLVAGVAHELKNPITFLKMSVHLLQMRLDQLRAGVQGPDAEATYDELGATLAACHDSIGRMVGIVDNLRMFSRIDPTVRQPVALERVLEDAIALVRPSYVQRITFDLQVDSAPPIMGVAGHLGQLFINLMANACQAIEAQGTVGVCLTTEPEGLVVRVTDTGAGMSPAILRRIFEPFFTTKPVGEGTGLGLSICHSIVEGHGGRIEVASTPGAGTTVTVLLPRGGCP